MKTWKRFEKFIARVFDGERVGVSGQSTPDVITDDYIIECKVWKAPSIAVLMNDLETAHQKRGGRRALAVMKRKGDRDYNAIVAVPRNDLADLPKGEIAVLDPTAVIPWKRARKILGGGGVIAYRGAFLFDLSDYIDRYH